MRKLIILILSVIINAVSAQPYEGSSYVKPDSIARANFNHSLKYPDKLAQLLVQGLDSEEQKFRAIFRWVADNIEYDLQTYVDTERMIRKYGKNSRKFRSWQARKNKYSYMRTLSKRKAVCSGYATLLKVMCNAVAIPCKVVVGYTKPWTGSIGVIELNHAWNAVELSGKWYLCDVTWASCALDLDKMKIIRRFDPIFFLTDPSLFAAQHYPKDPSWLLLYPKPTLEDFKNSPKISSAFLQNKINHYGPTKGVIRAKKNQPIEFSFTSNLSSVDPFVSFLVVEKKEKNYYDVPLEQDETSVYCYYYTFLKRGRFNVSVFINGNKTFEYLAYVK